MALLWLVAPCSLVEDGGSKHLWNVGTFLPYLRGTTTQETAIFTLAKVRTSSLKCNTRCTVCLCPATFNVTLVRGTEPTRTPWPIGYKSYHPHCNVWATDSVIKWTTAINKYRISPILRSTFLHFKNPEIGLRLRLIPDLNKFPT
jgi:hypothetical protein